MDAGVKYDISKDRNKNLGVNLIPFYKNVDLLEATAVINADEKRLFAAVPSYRPEAIELSAIFEDSLDKVNAAKEKLQQDVDFDHLKTKLESLKDSFNGERLDWVIHVVYDRCGEATLEKEPYSAHIMVGFYGNDVYFQGLCSWLPEAWAKGTWRA